MVINIKKQKLPQKVSVMNGINHAGELIIFNLIQPPDPTILKLEIIW